MPFSDFDFQIDEILLVHKNALVPQFRWTGYKGGREMDGLVLAVSGEALFDFGEERLRLLPGNLIFLPSDSNYTLKCDGKESFHHYTVNFRLRDVHAESNSVPAEILYGRTRHITDPAHFTRYSGHFEELLSIWQGKNTGYLPMARSRLCEILCLYLTDAGHSLRNRSDCERLQAAVHVLNKSYAENHSIAELAAMCGMSETHFRRVFRRMFGCSPTEYRISKRILRARDLLNTGQYTVSEISCATGFSDPSYFSRVFRAHTGMSPFEFTHR